MILLIALALGYFALERFGIFSFHDLLYRMEDLPFADQIRNFSGILNSIF